MFYPPNLGLPRLPGGLPGVVRVVQVHHVEVVAAVAIFAGQARLEQRAVVCSCVIDGEAFVFQTSQNLKCKRDPAVRWLIGT